MPDIPNSMRRVTYVFFFFLQRRVLYYLLLSDRPSLNRYQGMSWEVKVANAILTTSFIVYQLVYINMELAL